MLLKQFKYRIFGILALITLSLSALAQEEKLRILKADSTEFLEKSAEEKENQDELAAENIYVDRHPNDTEIGTFEINISNENFLLRIGGFAKLSAYYDAGLENELFFDLYKIATQEEKPQQVLTYMGPMHLPLPGNPWWAINI